MTDDAWPEVPLELSERPQFRDQALLALFTARVAVATARNTADIAASAAQVARNSESAAVSLAVEDRSREATFQAYLDVSKTVLDRMLRRAELVASGSASLAAVYGVVLGIAYSVKDGAPLPTRALVPVAFLGISLTLVGIFVGFVDRKTFVGFPLGRGVGQAAARERLNTFIGWVNATALARTWALRSAIASLALGILTIPFAFLSTAPYVLATLVMMGIIVGIFVEVVREP